MTQASKPSGYSADTEILTRRGWLTFDQLADGDEVATRSPNGQFEWQSPRTLCSGVYDGNLIHFASRGVDLFVTPDHGVLYLPNHDGARTLIDRSDAVARLRPGRMLATSTWRAPELDWWQVPPSERGYAIIESARLKTARVNLGITQVALGKLLGISRASVIRLEREHERRHVATLAVVREACQILGLHEDEIIHRDDLDRIDGDDFAAFMGMYLSEGCVSLNQRGNATIYISQEAKSKGFGPYRELLIRILGCEPGYDGHSWYFWHDGFAYYLYACGHGAHNKRIPPEVLELPKRQLQIFWDNYRLGDGWRCRTGEAIVTTSAVLASQLQEVTQKMGLCASVHRRPGSMGGSNIAGRPIRGARDRYDIFRRTTVYPMWTKTEAPAYSGPVYRIGVPNQVIYVRRNGRAIWAADGSAV